MLITKKNTSVFVQYNNIFQIIICVIILNACAGAENKSSAGASTSSNSSSSISSSLSSSSSSVDVVIDDPNIIEPAIVSIPGTLQLEDYVAFSDTTAGNAGMVYREDDVDLELVSGNDAGENYNVGWISPDEWLEYAINVTETNYYDIAVLAASMTNGGSIHFELDGSYLGDALRLPGTGGWQSWAATRLKGVELVSGEHSLRVYMDSGEFNLDALTFTIGSEPTDPVISPFKVK